MKNNKLVLAVLSLLFVLLTNSCVTAKQYPPGMKSPKELSGRFGFKVSSRNNLYLYAELDSWLGVRYQNGGNTRNGVDCSGLAVQVCNTVYDKKLDRSSSDILKNNCRKIRKKELREGDLVFFSISSGRKKVADHMGIYLKKNYFVHASSHNVKVDKLSDKYYKKYWLAAGRLK